MVTDYKDVVKTRREKFIEEIKSKLSIEDIRGLYDFMNVDDDVYISMDGGVQSLTPFGADGPKLENAQNLEIYATDKYAREFAQKLIRVRFNQLINAKKEEVKKERKISSPK